MSAKVRLSLGCETVISQIAIDSDKVLLSGPGFSISLERDKCNRCDLIFLKSIPTVECRDEEGG